MKQLNKKIVLFDIDHTLFDTAFFKNSQCTNMRLYDEVFQLLKNISKIATLGIFSEGDIELQIIKLKKTEILNFFPKKQIYIFDKKDLEIERVMKIHNGVKIFLIDDKLTTLYKAKSIVPDITVIWVKRGRYAFAQKAIEDFKPDFVLDTLRNLKSIVENN